MRPGLGGHALLDIDGDGDGRAVGGGLGDVEVGLIQRHGLHHLGNVAEDAHDLNGHLTVAVEAGPDDDAVRALAHGGGHGHGRVDAKPPRLVGRRGHHAPTLGPAAHQHGQPAQLWVIELLHGGVEGIQIGVDDVANVSGAWGSAKANAERMPRFYPRTRRKSIMIGFLDGWFRFDARRFLPRRLVLPVACCGQGLRPVIFVSLCQSLMVVG